MDNICYEDFDPLITELQTSKIVCVGRNYAAHARELDNPVPDTPIFFIKPSTARVAIEPSFAIPVDRGECHIETEIALLIGKPVSSKSTEIELRNAVVGIGVGLDLTLRDLQNQLKSKGHPWERAKAFDGSCPLSKFIPIDLNDLDESLGIRLLLNGQTQQQGSIREMIWQPLELLKLMTEHFSLLAGDVVLTGTPAGVTALQPGDEISIELSGLLNVEARVLSQCD